MVRLAGRLLLQDNNPGPNRSKQQISLVKEIRLLAEKIVEEIPPNTLFTSHDDVWNDSMKQRLQSKVLPGLFCVAQSREDFIHRRQLADRAIWVTWERLPKHRPHKQIKKPRITHIPQPDQVIVISDSGRTSSALTSVSSTASLAQELSMPSETNKITNMSLKLDSDALSLWQAPAPNQSSGLSQFCSRVYDTAYTLQQTPFESLEASSILTDPVSWTTVNDTYVDGKSVLADTWNENVPIDSHQSANPERPSWSQGPNFSTSIQVE
jgi:hypothetical protein